MRRADRRTVRRRVATTTVAAAGFAALFVAAAPARAQATADRWADAIREQQEAISSNRASRARCAPANDPRCTALAERGRLMESNLGRLQREHARLVGSSAAAQAQAQASRRAPMQEAAPGVAARPVEAPQQRSLFSMLFGGGTTEVRRSTVRIDGVPAEETLGAGTSDGPASGDVADWGAHSGSYRTLCVRTCDGYFFPVSFNASRARLSTDANVCRALCPEATTRLYFHDASGQEAENAVAADDGTPLAEMPNAFLYRTKRVAGCTCGRPDPHSLPVKAGGLGGVEDVAADPADVPLPRVRPSPDEDPATQAVQLSGLPTEPVAPSTPLPQESADRIAAVAPPTVVEPRRVRIVGPKWLSDRSEATAASSPARDPAP